MVPAALPGGAPPDRAGLRPRPVLPGGLTGLAIGLAGPLGPTLAVSNTILAALWLAFTFVAFGRARERRFAEHRRWMVRSFALTMSIITNRVTGFVWVLVLLPELPSSMDALMRTASSLAAWTGWIGSLLVAEW